MRVLITGGAGFIGSHLAEYLRERADVRILDNLGRGDRRRLRHCDITFVQASVLDTTALRGAVSGVDLVFHLAAMVSVQESMENPQACVETNVLGTLNVLQAATDAGVRKLVFASSAAIYGEDPPVPTPETAVPKPKSPYAITKLDGEYYCEIFRREGWLKTAALRFFNVFGPGQDPASPYAPAVPAFFRQALCGQPLAIFGDGEQSRDFIHVKDAVSALAFVAEAGELSGAFNCGYGRPTTVNELVRRILALTQSESQPKNFPERSGDVRHSCASTEKLRAAGWRPVSSLEQGLRETMEGLRQDFFESTKIS
jgi:UDP-glucose 4-epimerase